jgi:ribosomal protein L11 methyltransferase
MGTGGQTQYLLLGKKRLSRKSAISIIEIYTAAPEVSMKWIKASIQTTPAGTEPLSEFLLSHGIAGVEIIDPREFGVFSNQDPSSWDYVDGALLEMSDAAYVVFYLLADDDGFFALEQIKSELPSLESSPVGVGSLALSTERVDDADWLDEWKKYFAPIRIGRVGIVPAWDNGFAPLFPPPEVTFTLDTGSAFGTGQHATTYLCVQALQDVLVPGQWVLDIGCGSGILSVVGLLLGAGGVCAYDIDPAAVSATRRNAALNPVDVTRLHVAQGNILTDGLILEESPKINFDIIMANIVADVIVALAPKILDLLALGGRFIASGIITGRDGDVASALGANGLDVIENRVMDGWHCLICKRAGESLA